MCARTDPNLNLFKTKHYEDRSARPRPPPEQKTKQKRKRLGEMYITTDKLDRLTLQASTFQTHSDAEVPLKSHCFGHLPSRSGPSVHLCWEFDDPHPGEEKSAELITALNEVVKILKNLDADDDEHPGTAGDVQLKNGEESSHGNAMPSGHASEMNVSREKEPKGDDDMNGNDFDLKKHETFVTPEREKNGRGTSRPKCKACKAPASRTEETRFDRKADEHACPAKGREASESAGRQLGTVLHCSALKSVYQAADHNQPEDTMPLENVHERNDENSKESSGEGLATEPAVDASTPGTNKEPDSASESEGELSDCEIVNSDTDAPPGFENYKPKDPQCDSDEETDKTSLFPDEWLSEEREIPDMKSCHELEIKAECPVNFQYEGDLCPGSQHSELDDQRKENLSCFTSDLEGKITATSIDVADEHGEHFLQTENPKDSSTDSSDNGLLYEDEQMFHDSVIEPKRKSSKDHEVFSMSLRSGGDHFLNPNVYHDSNPHDPDKRQKPSRYRRIKLGPDPDLGTVPEVDGIFSGPKWKTLDPRVRVKTILDQFHYLVNLYREGAEREGVKKSRWRPDIHAGKYLMAKRFCFNEGWSVVGNIPGVEVGDTFMYREELLILIVHRTSQAGIEYIPAPKSGFLDKNGCPAAVAVSVVSAGGYRDTEDDGETMTYIGSGGLKNMTYKRSAAGYADMEKDQELVRGNLALKNSCELGVPVRVIRGEKNADGEVMKKSYWYDGLYDVTKYYEEKGSAGSKVWKFQLVKQKGQRES